LERDIRADRAADGDAEDDQPPAAHSRLHEGRDDGDRHAGDAEGVALAPRFRRRQPAQRQDEQDRRREIEKGGERPAHGFAFSFLRNLLSMRCVTTKPPKMLTEASTTPRKPKAVEKPAVLSPAARIAPTMITLEIALVTDISGECSAGVHVPHHVVADEAGQPEHREAGGQRVGAMSRHGGRLRRQQLGDARRHPGQLRLHLGDALREGGGIHRYAPDVAEVGVVCGRAGGRAWWRESGMHDLALAGEDDALHDIVVGRQGQRAGLLVEERRQEV